ncbi:hypothetical protein [Microbispora rosea]|uniref:hypothetical protein n=1 Tax=Microbispora rosea TaxID=58117 RepID=UPI0012DBFE86|nr:hypothetical protein [Microbispora rosea]
MNSDGMFHIDESGRLLAMRLAPYEAEEVLQTLLATHPDLLAGGQMTPGDPRRWLLIRREAGVPDRDGGGGRWSLDHLFVDQDGIPTLVEVKRASDSRIRREVVGQMLDYAANGVLYWPVHNLQALFEQTQRESGHDPQGMVAQLCGDDTVTVETFFAKVGDNLRAGKIRMVFVADAVPDDLRRIVEFLNEQMNPAEVLAVEVKQYVAEDHGLRTLVPAVYGRTAAASAKSAIAQPSLRELRDKADEDVRALWTLLEQWADEGGRLLTNTAAGVIVSSRNDLRIAQLYPKNRALCINLDPLRGRGREELAEACLATLRTLTNKPLTSAYPFFPAHDAVAKWDDIVKLLDQLATA